MTSAFLWSIYFIVQAGTVPSNSSKVSWAKEIGISSLTEIKSRLSEPLGDMPEAVLENRSVRPIKTCRDVLALEKVKFHLSPDNDLAWDSLESEAVRCSALDVLRTAKSPTASYLSWFTFSRSGISRLPARFTISSSEDEEKDLRKADKTCERWGQYDPSLKVTVKGEVAKLHTDYWSGRLVLYARGDFTGDGIEDLMVLREGKVKEGTASDSTLFIVSQTSEKACPRIIRTLPESLGMGTKP